MKTCECADLCPSRHGRTGTRLETSFCDCLEFRIPSYQFNTPFIRSFLNYTHSSDNLEPERQKSLIFHRSHGIAHHGVSSSSFLYCIVSLALCLRHDLIASAPLNLLVDKFDCELGPGDLLSGVAQIR